MIGKDNKDENIHIRTIICGDNKKPKLVFIHGYGASGAMYFNLIKPLTEHFHLIMIDMLGMGGSSRPKNSYDYDHFSP